jgi:epoxyqueuosine reductase
MESTGWTPELRAWVEAEARACDFATAGVAALEHPEEPGAAEEAERFDAWVAAGYAGEMEYLKRADDAGRSLRGGVRVAMPWARSVVVCAMNYNADAAWSIDPAPSETGWIGRYAWSGRRDADGSMAATDYHDELLRRLRRIEAGLAARVGCETRCYVDTGPILERSVAAHAGVGWIGRNTCVLNQELGSWLLLGVIVTSLAVPAELAAVAAPDRCGSCTRCIDACPTGALPVSNRWSEWREMDASKCIAYLTIEKKGPIPEELREGMGRQVFGCDICQEVCPWNSRAPVGGQEGMAARRELVNPSLAWLAGLDGKEFKRWFKGSPLERTGRRRLLRNVANAMGNAGDRQHLTQLGAWAGAADDAVLAEAAAWATRRIQSLNPAAPSASIEEIPDPA